MDGGFCGFPAEQLTWRIKLVSRASQGTHVGAGDLTAQWGRQRASA